MELDVLVLLCLSVLVVIAHDVGIVSPHHTAESSGYNEEQGNIEHSKEEHIENHVHKEDLLQYPDSQFKDDIQQIPYEQEKLYQAENDVRSALSPKEVDGETNESIEQIAEEESAVVNEDSLSGEESVDSKSKTRFQIFPLWTIFKELVESLIDEFGHDVEKPIEEEKENQTSLNETSVVEVVEIENVTSTLTEPEEIAEKVKNITEPVKNTKFQCTGRNGTENETNVVQIVNNTGLLNSLNFDTNETGTDCVLVLFYAPWCPFCAEAAPAFNALARAFKQLDVLAVDAAHFSNLNAKFGTASVPNILLFHQSRSAVRYNQSERTFESFVSFVKNYTGLEPNTSVEVSEEDYEGPLPSLPTEETDYLLWVAWIFFVVCSIYFFVQSSYGQQWINKIIILWQEHQHID